MIGFAICMGLGVILSALVRQMDRLVLSLQRTFAVKGLDTYF